LGSDGIKAGVEVKKDMAVRMQRIEGGGDVTAVSSSSSSSSVSAAASSGSRVTFADEANKTAVCK
jgi:hypothetical protein